MKDGSDSKSGPTMNIQNIHSESQLKNLPPKVRLISFGGGIKDVKKLIERFSRQAKSFHLIDEFQIFTEVDLRQDYLSEFQEIIRNNPKGYGLWSWKPYLIKREMQQLNEGDILIYLDLGVEINKQGLSRFTHYLDFLAKNDTLFFSLDHQHRHYTKPDQRLLPIDKHYFRNQVVAGVLMFRITSETKDFVSEWFNMCKLNQGSLLVDTIPVSGNGEIYFKNHRHDQSLLSRLVFERGLTTIPDETIFRPWRLGKKYPFLALRNTRGRFSWMWWVMRAPFVVWHIVYYITNPKLFRARFPKNEHS